MLCTLPADATSHPGGDFCRHDILRDFERAIDGGQPECNLGSNSPSQLTEQVFS